MCQGKKITRKQRADFLLSLEANHGNASAAARSVGSCYKTMWTYRKEDKDFADAWDEITTSHDFRKLDVFNELVEQGNVQCLLFWMKTKGQNYGFVEKQHIETEITQANIIVRDEATKAALEGIE